MNRIQVEHLFVKVGPVEVSVEITIQLLLWHSGHLSITILNIQYLYHYSISAAQA